MPTRILLTGFEAFGDIPTNPSQLAVESLRTADLPGISLITDILPVSYAAAGDCMRNLIRTHRPDLIVAVGVAGSSEEIRLERVALNLDDAAGPDNEGAVRQGEPILPDGPPAYFSNLPLAGLKEALAVEGFPVRISNHAGAYLCNHAYYAAAHEVELLGLPTGVLFIHVPLPHEMKGAGRMTQDAITDALRTALQWLTGP